MSDEEEEIVYEMHEDDLRRVVAFAPRVVTLRVDSSGTWGLEIVCKSGRRALVCIRQKRPKIKLTGMDVWLQADSGP